MLSFGGVVSVHCNIVKCMPNVFYPEKSVIYMQHHQVAFENRSGSADPELFHNLPFIYSGSLHNALVILILSFWVILVSNTIVLSYLNIAEVVNEKKRTHAKFNQKWRNTVSEKIVAIAENRLIQTGCCSPVVLFKFCSRKHWGSSEIYLGFHIKTSVRSFWEWQLVFHFWPSLA